MRVNRSMECDVRNDNHHQVDDAADADTAAADVDDDVVVAVIADTNENARLAY